MNHFTDFLSVQSKFDNVIKHNQWNFNHFMTKQPITQSQKRASDSLASLFIANSPSPMDFIFLKSSSDVGVERNGGRNGARLAPQSFLSYFKRLNKRPDLEKKVFSEFEVASIEEEKNNFHEAQEAQSHRIHQIIAGSPDSFVCHLGGGHDHIYPLLSALSHNYQKIIVINIDAHADTRTDEEFHSGTPFRQFANSFSGHFHLYQTGLLEWANSASTLSPLSRGHSKILWRQELYEEGKLESFFQEISLQVSPQTAVIFSLDADALSGQEIPGVSAVNGHGLCRQELSRIWKLYRALPFQHGPIMGIYELNPVYDSLSMLSMRTLGSFVYEAI